MTLLKFGGFTPPSPTTYEIEVTDADGGDSGRNENGVMHRDRVRGGDNPIYSIQVGWDALSDDEMKAILNAVKNTSVTVSFYFGAVRNKKMYAGNRKLKLKAAPKGVACWELSFPLTEY